MTLPVVNVVINFSTGAGFAPTLVLDDPVYGILGTDALGDSASTIVDVSDVVQSVNITRGRNALSDVFQTGTLGLRIADQTGAFNPSNTSSPYYGLLQPLRKVTITATDPDTSITWPLFAGYITGYNYQQSQFVGEVSTTTITAVDGFRLLNLATLSTVTGATAGDLSGTRINQILDEIAWPSTLRDVDAGLTTMQANPTNTRTALAALSTVSLSEYGALYMDALGNVTFQDRTVTAGSVANTPTVFADDGTGIKYHQVKWVFDDTQIYNDVTITRTGGTAQNSKNTSSIETYFNHSYDQTDLLMQTDAVALDYAQAYCASRAETSTRCDAITLDLTTPSYTAGITAALSLDYFDQVTVKSTQPNTVGTSSLNKTLQVFGVSHAITPNTWFTTFTTLEPIIDSLILDSVLEGILDTDVLSY
jgi:hypothetical protein